MKKIIVLLLLLCVPAVAWAGDTYKPTSAMETMDKVSIILEHHNNKIKELQSQIDSLVSLQEKTLSILQTQSERIDKSNSRIGELEKRLDDLPRLTLPDDTHSWTLTPN